MTHLEGVIEAIAQEMRRDERVLFIGQDVGPFGGSMQGSRGLYEEFGPERILEAPISESAMVGAAIGASLFGRRPIVEISFGEFLPAAMNQLINQAPNIRYMTAGRARTGRRADAGRRRALPRPPAGLLGLVRARARLDGRRAGDAGGREGADGGRDPLGRPGPVRRADVARARAARR